ncbi:MAG: hypothetical protein ACRDCE_15510 [Cetobacterium sp.]|uniref:hypothetical protein n=1 Tax=Cetobacterium sp. TaxID=2071632 RepID=UPI003EE56D2D
MTKQAQTFNEAAIAAFTESNPTTALFYRMFGVMPTAVVSSMLEGEQRGELLTTPDDALQFWMSDGDNEQVKAEPLARQWFALNIIGEAVAKQVVFGGMEVPEGYKVMPYITPEKYNAWDKKGLFIDALCQWSELPAEQAQRVANNIKVMFEASEVPVI